MYERCINVYCSGLSEYSAHYSTLHGGKGIHGFKGEDRKTLPIVTQSLIALLQRPLANEDAHYTENEP